MACLRFTTVPLKTLPDHELYIHVFVFGNCLFALRILVLEATETLSESKTFEVGRKSSTFCLD